MLTGGRRKLLEGELKDGSTSNRRFCLVRTICGCSRRRFWPGAGGDHLQNDGRSAGAGNDTQYGLGAGVWSRNGNLALRWGAAYRLGACGPTVITLTGTCGVWWLQTIRYRSRNPQEMLEHYQQTKCLLVSYSDKPWGCSDIRSWSHWVFIA